MDLDELVRDAKPTTSARPPMGWDERWRTQMTAVDVAQRRRRRRGSFAIGVPLVVAAVAVTITVPRWGSNTPSAAAAVLDAAATTVSSQPPLIVGPGQYTYTVVHSLMEAAVYQSQTELSSGTLASAATATYSQTEQLWINPSGVGRVVISRGPLQFSSQTDQAAWEASPTVQGLASNAFQAQQTYTDISYATTDVSGLSTDPQSLGVSIAEGDTGTSVDAIPAGPGADFERAARLLVGPDRGMTPALESALYQVLADQPTATVTADAVGQSGAEGTAVAIPNASPGNIERIIIDPTTGAALEVDAVPPASTRSAVSGRATVCTSSATSCTSQSTPPSGRGAVSVGPLWTTQTAPVVVESDTSTEAVNS